MIEFLMMLAVDVVIAVSWTESSVLGSLVATTDCMRVRVSPYMGRCCAASRKNIEHTGEYAQRAYTP